MKHYSSWSRFTRLATPLATCAVGLAISLPAAASPPSQPGSPAGAISGSTVNLSWTPSTDNVGVAGYNVYRNNRYVSTVSESNYSGEANASEANDFYVIAFDTPLAKEARLFSSRSPIFTLLSTAPSGSGPTPTTPTALSAVRTSPTTASLTWTASTDDVRVAGYNVYRNNQYITTVANPRLSDIQLIAGTEYIYYVVAFDEARNFSNRSAEANTSGAAETPVVVVPPVVEMPVVVPPTTAPDTTRPAIVQAVDAMAITDGVIVSWAASTDNVGVEGYNLYRNGSYLNTVFATVYLDTESPSDNSASYSVVAFDAAKNFSTNSNVATISTDTIGPVEPPITVEPPVVVEPPVTVEPPVIDGPTIPTLRDPIADATPSPPIADPFGSLLEIDSEAAVVGGPPTQPKNLRAELVSNDWAEINWAPANDDGEVVEYRIYRSDGVVYTVRGDTTDPSTNAVAENNRFWNGTLFLDCNYTRFDQRIYNCRDNAPKAGDEFFYEVSAIDDEGQESARSEPLEIIYHIAENAPIPYYDDFYKLPNDRFVQEHDLSRVSYFLDEFETVFADEFDGTTINEDYWNTGLVWGDTRIINGEQQYFVNPQAQPDFGYDPFNLTGETLIIESIPTPTELEGSLPEICDTTDPLGKERCAFLSGALSSHDKFGITYGYVESRMKVGSAVGSLSSFYLYNRYPGTGRNLHAPEIDIIEYLGENPFGDELAFQTYHYANVNDGTTNSAPTMFYENPDGTKFDEDFHTFGVLWEPQLVIWYIDGVEIKRMTGPQVGRQQMNIVAYLVSGSAWAPTPDVDADIYPLQFEIDYIRAYQRSPYDTNGLYPE